MIEGAVKSDGNVGPLMYDTHMHTPLCRHATGEPEEYAEAALRRGFAGIIFTCHNPLPGGLSQGARMYPEQFPEYVQLVRRAAEAFRGRLDVRLGIEADFLPGWDGLVEFTRRQLSETPFHYVIGSVHPHIREYIALHDGGDPVAFQKTYFTHLAEAAESGLFDTISHPDLVKNCYPKDWELPRVMDHVKGCLDRIAATGVAMELNTSGMLKVIPEFNPSCGILAEMRVRGIPVVLGSDSHVPGRVGDRFEEAMDVLAGVGYEKVSFFLDRKRRDVPIDRAKASLR
jgi:histidinol-phosphatase (PHP family)